MRSTAGTTDSGSSITSGNDRGSSTDQIRTDRRKRQPDRQSSLIPVVLDCPI